MYSLDNIFTKCVYMRCESDADSPAYAVEIPNLHERNL